MNTPHELPSNSSPHYLSALELLQTEQFAEAETVLRKALVEHPGDAHLRVLLGNALSAMVLTKQAEVEYRTAIALHPRSPFAHFNLGVLLYEAGAVDEAVKHFQLAAELADEPERKADAYDCLGNSLADLGRFDEAISAFREGIAQNVDNWRILYNQGCLLRKLGNTNEAIAAFEDAISLHNTDPSVHYNLGNAYRAIGRFADAAAAYLRAIDLKPNHAEARANYRLTVADLKRRPTTRD